MLPAIAGGALDDGQGLGCQKNPWGKKRENHKNGCHMLSPYFFFAFLGIEI